MLRSRPSIRNPLFSILYPLSSILYSLSSILYPLFSILYPLSSILYPLFSIFQPLSPILNTSDARGSTAPIPAPKLPRCSARRMQRSHPASPE